MATRVIVAASPLPRPCIALTKSDEQERPRFARLAASLLPRACIALTKYDEKERLLAVY